jgi:protein-tyrosine kinase
VDRIRKALDLARIERASGEAAVPANRPEAALVAVDPVPPEANGQADVLPRADTAAADGKAAQPLPRGELPIVYTRTKVFAPAADYLERNRVLDPSAPDRTAAAYRMLRTQVLQRMDAHAWRSLAVFSAGADDGKTTTAINLATSVAGDRLHTVLLVDFDLRHPRLGTAFGLAPEFGVDDVLAGVARLEDCLYHPEGFERLVLLPSRAPLHNSSEVLAGPRSRKLVEELRARYPERVIIFDLPPVLHADDALAFAPYVDCGLVVASEGHTRRNDLKRTMELLSKTPIVGTVLNRATDASAGY